MRGVDEDRCVLEEPRLAKLAQAFDNGAALGHRHRSDCIERDELDVGFTKHHAEEGQHSYAVADERKHFERHTRAIEKVVGAGNHGERD